MFFHCSLDIYFHFFCMISKCVITRIKKSEVDLKQDQEVEHRIVEAEKKELDKKKPKINNFDEDCTADDYIAPRPSPFAPSKN